MKRAALFDVDGVLADSKAAQLATLAGYATSALDRRVTVDELPPDAANTPPGQVLAALGLHGPISEARWDAATATATLTTTAFPFVTDALRALRAEGVATGIVTRRDRRRLGWLLPPEVLSLMDTVVCYEDATPKPAPDGLLLALDQLRVAPGNAVFVGDTDVDFQAARAAGVTAVAAAWGYTRAEDLVAVGAELVVLEPAELAAALLQMLDTGLHSKRS